MPKTPKDLTPLQQAALGVAISLAGLGVALACGTGSQPLFALERCQLEALRVLPSDPKMATVYDVADIVERIRACRLEHGPRVDAGP